MNVFNYFFENTYALTKDLVVGTRETISYQSLFRNAGQLSNQIKNQYGENQNILVLSDNSVFFITVYLAILKSGNVCIPINQAIETGNLNKIVSKTEAKIAFINKKYENRFGEFNFDILNEDNIKAQIECIPHSVSIDENEFDGNRLAEIIFTSGSTGEQKGVMISHNNIIANTNSILKYLNLTENDTIEIVMPFYYCYGLSLLHTHIRVGGSIVLNNNFMFIGSVINDLNKYSCTGFAGVPSHFQILLRKTRDFKTTKFHTLKYVTQAGGKLHQAFIKEFMEAFPDIQFYVMYGQTEATARLSYLPPDELERKLGSIGKGIPDVVLKVVNEVGEQVKPGEVGEIIAKGENIMSGYYKDEEATTHAIRNGWLYTGDLATVDNDGYIFIESRKKEIIKVRGFRVSPKEIEEVIVSYPGVIDCSIQAENDEITGESIHAIIYVNEADLKDFTEDSIRKHCADLLAPHKIPQRVTFDTKLSFNTSGKKSKF